MTNHLLILLALAGAMVPGRASAGPVVLVSVGDAFVSRDVKGGVWAIGNGAISFTLSIDRGSLKAARLLDRQVDRLWDLELGPDTFLTINGARRDLAPEQGFVLLDADPSEWNGGAHLALTFESRGDRLRVTRHYVSYPEAPVVETWTSFELTDDNVVTAADLNAFELTVGAGRVTSITGLQAPESRGGSFTVRRSDLSPGERLSLGSPGRASEWDVPWFALERDEHRFFGGIMWSGSWSASLERLDERMRVSVGLAGMSTVIGDALETPHGFFGVTAGEVSVAMQSFVQHGLRRGRAFEPLVTYNTWFQFGADIDETSMLEEMRRVAPLGVELFVIDAGWYAGARSTFDHTSGLGAWRTDPSRFPEGLRPLADQARRMGMRFGVWVEPERVALDTVGRPGLAQQRWLATDNGRYDPTVEASAQAAAQICLADAGARQWALEQLVRFLDEVHPDYLKWDNNFWINCNREGHGHGATDGNFAHVAGLYRLLAEIRERYPALLIENCSGGGNRLDLGMLRYSDVAWMDDRSAPSVQVRHNVEGLGQAFPPAYLLSFVMPHTSEPIHNASDLSLYMRSRMPAVLGLAFLVDELTEGEQEEVGREVAIYKAVRETQRDASAILLSAQTPAPFGQWDAIEEVSASTGDAVIFAFLNDSAPDRTLVRPRGLLRSAQYEIRSVDRGTLGTRTGAELMDEGIELIATTQTDGHVLVLKALMPAARRP